MTLPDWLDGEAPRDPAILTCYLLEALAVTANLRGHNAFARLLDTIDPEDLRPHLCSLVWEERMDWATKTFVFWGLYYGVSEDHVMLDLIDTICTMLPLGDDEDETEADAYWPDVVATVRGTWQGTAS